MIDNLMWLAMAAALAGNIFVIYKKRTGFGIWFFTNWIWVAYDIHKEAYAQACMMFIYAGMAAWGWYHWGKQGPS